MTVTQVSSVLIGLTVFLGLIIPGGTRYLLLGGVLLLLGGVAIFGNVTETLHFIRR